MSLEKFFKAAQKREEKDYELPELGKVKLRQLDGVGYLEYIRDAHSADIDEVTKRAKLISLSVYQKGKRVFGETKVAQLAKMNGGFIHPLWAECAALNGFIEADSKN